MKIDQRLDKALFRVFVLASLMAVAVRLIEPEGSIQTCVCAMQVALCYAVVFINSYVRSDGIHH